MLIFLYNMFMSSINNINNYNISIINYRNIVFQFSIINIMKNIFGEYNI